jgi:F0F1-type ATP synthase assembly protein I
MNRQEEPQEIDQKQYNLNLAMAAIAGQVGLVTLIVIVVALVGGLALDKYLNTKPMFTIILMLASVPVTVVLMFRIVRAATSRIKPSVKQKSQSPTEESNRE